MYPAYLQPLADSVPDLLRYHRASFRPGFPTWISVNLHVWFAFEREANRIWRRGRRHYSARTILEVLRHESALAEIYGDFKLNNNVAPDLARLYRLRYPERAGLFELRQMPGSERAA